MNLFEEGLNSSMWFQLEIWLWGFDTPHYFYIFPDIWWDQSCNFVAGKLGSKYKLWFVQLIRLKGKQQVSSTTYVQSWMATVLYYLLGLVGGGLVFAFNCIVKKPTVIFFTVSGLKDILGDLPRREASQFRKQVSYQSWKHLKSSSI